MGHAASMSLYDFCNGDPVNCFDADGRLQKKAAELSIPAPAAALFINNPELFIALAELQLRGGSMYDNVRIIAAFDSEGNPNGAWAMAQNLNAYRDNRGQLYDQGKVVGTEAAWFFTNPEAAALIQKQRDFDYTVAVAGQVAFTTLSANFSGFGGPSPSAPTPNMRVSTSAAPAAESAAVRAGSSVDELVAAAQKAYPGKAGTTELHHITPKYLGGAADGPLAPLDAAYHQQITNAFRDAWKYGQPKPSAQQLEQIMKDVYSKYPLPPAR